MAGHVAARFFVRVLCVPVIGRPGIVFGALRGIDLELRLRGVGGFGLALRGDRADPSNRSDFHRAVVLPLARSPLMKNIGSANRNFSTERTVLVWQRNWSTVRDRA